MNELTDEELLYASEEDWAFYNKIIEGLPTMGGKNGDGLDKFGVPIPYHSGPHILRHFMSVLDLVLPNKILEIGFNMGHSAMMWLNLCGAFIFSCDVSNKDETVDSAKLITANYPERFSYVNRKCDAFDMLVTMHKFDLCWIDGAHDDESITQDIELAKRLIIPYILFDDWYPRYGETQKSVARFPELELVKDMNNLRLYKVNYDKY